MAEIEARCMICGHPTAAGRHICMTCEGTDDMQTFRPLVRTNGDRIRAMNDRELAAFLVTAAQKAYAGFHDEQAVAAWLGERPK